MIDSFSNKTFHFITINQIFVKTPKTIFLGHFGQPFLPKFEQMDFFSKTDSVTGVILSDPSLPKFKTSQITLKNTTLRTFQLNHFDQNCVFQPSVTNF